MKGKKCFGLLLALFTIFGLSLSVFSDYANAIDLTQNVSYLGSLSANTYVYLDMGSGCTVNNSGTVGFIHNSGSSRCSFWSRLNVLSSTGFNSDYIVGITVNAYELRDREPINAYLNESGTLQLYSYDSFQTELQFIGTETQTISETSVLITYYFKFATSGNIYANISNFRFYPRVGINANEYATVSTNIQVVALSNYNITVNTNNQDVINAIVELKNSNSSWLSQINQNIQEVRGAIVNLQNQQSQQNQQDQQDRENIENQQNDVSSSSDNSSNDARTTGTTLLGAFSGFVNALTNARPSNCKINMDLGNLDMGIVDLCQLSPPQPIPTIASIMLILFCVPLSIATARKVISLFRSFQ